MAVPSNAPEFERLPYLYQRWAEEMLPGGIPREHVATCLDCVMCPKPGMPPQVDEFHPAAKCCTYFPSLPNFLVGRAIDEDSAGAAVLRAFIEHPNAGDAEVTPLFVGPNRKFDALYKTAGGEFFGRDATLLCPYAIDADSPEGPLCGIWQSRNSVCSTYFCKHVRGTTGRQFWMTLRNLYAEIERVLVWWAADQVLPDMDAVLALNPQTMATQLKLELKGNAWDQWQGNRLDYYRACARCVEELRWEDVLDISGLKLRLHLRDVLGQYGALTSSAVPGRLRTLPIKVLKAGADRCMLQGDPPGELFEVPAVLVQLLPYFDGRPTSEILAEIQENHGIEIETGLIRRLCDFGVLADADEAAVDGKG